MLNQKARGKFPSLISEKKVKDIRLVLHLFILYHTLTQLASIQFVKTKSKIFALFFHK